MATDNSKSLTRRDRIALAGLRLPQVALRRLQESGIYCVPRISVALQQSAQRYLIRAHESGGAVADLGAYCGVVSADGTPLPWRPRIETIGVNGLHARTLAPSLVRIQILRVQHTYDLLLTKHELGTASNGHRPELTNSIIFRGRHGTLEMELWGKDAAFRGRVCPVFYDVGGDPLVLPPQFAAAVRSAVAGVTCCGCTHSHLLVPPATSNVPEAQIAGPAEGSSLEQES
jgi:hypothetical protein